MADPIETAIIGAARRVLTRRAATLRKKAQGLVSSATDARGRTVLIVGPEASVMLTSALLFESVADELDGANR